MKRIFLSFVPMFAVFAASAQTEDAAAVSFGAESSVPVTTIVPVQDTPVHIVDSTTVYQRSSGKMTRAQRRARKADEFAARVDSLVRSRNFVFYPNSMQEIPSGEMQLIYADYCYFALSGDTAEVHLPLVRGIMQYVGMMNFDEKVADYRLLPFQSGLTATFSVTNDGNLYFGRLVVSEVTGETALTIVAPDTTMRYIGWLSRERRHDDKTEDL